MTQFIHIKPNNQYNSLITKLDDSIKNKLDNDDLIDIIEDIECIQIVKNEEPIKYINNFFNSENNINYDLVTIGTNYEKNQYYLLLSDKLINSTGYIKLEDSLKNVNMFGSKIGAPFNHNLPIYGDVFIIAINKLYFHMYDKMNDLKTNNIEITKKHFQDLENIVFDKIYYDYNINKLIDAYKNANFINIYSKTSNQIILYSRNFIEHFMRSNDSITVEDNEPLVILKYDNQIMYLKYDEPLTNSSYHIADKILERTYRNYYYVDIEPKNII
jgi:hypothetical protein